MGSGQHQLDGKAIGSAAGQRLGRVHLPVLLSFLHVIAAFRTDLEDLGCENAMDFPTLRDRNFPEDLLATPAIHEPLPLHCMESSCKISSVNMLPCRSASKQRDYAKTKTIHLRAPVLTK